MFTHLHTHSYYSLLRGLPSPAQLIDSTVKHGMLSLALTDHRLLTGALEFVYGCNKAGIQPVLGLELEVSPPNGIFTERSGILVFLAMDMSGWANLCQMSSLLSDENPQLSFDQLSSHTDGLICLTGGKRGLVNLLLTSKQQRLAKEWLVRLEELFPKRLYTELQEHSIEDKDRWKSLASISRSLKLPVVASHDVHYVYNEQAELQRTLAAIRLIRPLNDLPPDAVAPPQAYFKTPAEMRLIFEGYPEALEATQEIASRCRFELPLGQPRFPEIPMPPGASPLEVLRQKAQAGASQLYGEINLEIQARLDHEIQVIGECGYATLFLIMEEILSFARQQGIPFSSRGSAASSLVAHCLGITSPDPIRLNLYFERFLNPARATPPDIDTDLCSRRRDEVIRHVYERFGEDQVATICTINRFRRRSALRETAKAFGLPADEVSALADSLPSFWYGPGRRSEEKDPFAELARKYNTPIHQAVFSQAAALIGLPNHLSLHPGGIVISPGKMTDLVPTQMAAKGVVSTQFDMDAIQMLGLVKIDLLGIRGLTVLGDVAQEIPQQKENLPFPVHLNFQDTTARSTHILDSIPEQDPETSDVLERGKTIGCFQIESPGMRATLKEIHARTVDDLMVALALYRPGPLTGGLKTAFVRRHLGKEPSQDIHPAIAALLADTYGVILYQEQVLRIAHELAGLSLADADLLRRAMSHFDPGKQMKTLQEKFVAGVWNLHQVPETAANRIWELMAAFAGYGFPKAHAASYAQISWRSAWCKTHLPAFFMAAVLANWGGYYSQRIYLTEARRMGLTLRPPLINYAAQEFSLNYIDREPVLLMGLNQVKELTRRTQAAIISKRPFSSFIDFLGRVDPRPIEVENLVKVGALEGFGTIPELLDQSSGSGWRGGQMSLFPLDSNSQQDWTLQEKVDAQESILGVGVIAHTLELAADKIKKTGALTTLEAAARLNEHVRVVGMRQTWRRSLTTRVDYIYFLSLEDLEGMLDVIISSEVYSRSRAELSGHGPYIIEGLVLFDEEKSEPFIRADKIWKLT